MPIEVSTHLGSPTPAASRMKGAPFKLPLNNEHPSLQTTASRCRVLSSRCCRRSHSPGSVAWRLLAGA